MADTDSISAPDFDALINEKPGRAEAVDEVQTGQPRDEQGRFATKQQDETPKVVETEEAPPARSADAERGTGMVPSSRLREEAEARRKAEEALSARERAFQDELAALRRDMSLLRQPVQTQRQEPPKVPDLIEDPEGYRNYVLTETQRQYRKARIDETFEDARDNNPQAFDEAWAAVQEAPQSVKDQVINAANPGKALMRWHGQQKALAVVGTDVEGYRRKVEEETRAKLAGDPEFRKTIMEAMRAEAGASTRPSNVTDLPSVNRASGSSGHGDDGPPSFDAILPTAPRRR